MCTSARPRIVGSPGGECHPSSCYSEGLFMAVHKVGIGAVEPPTWRCATFRCVVSIAPNRPACEFGLARQRSVGRVGVVMRGTAVRQVLRRERALLDDATRAAFQADERVYAVLKGATRAGYRAAPREARFAIDEHLRALHAQFPEDPSESFEDLSKSRAAFEAASVRLGELLLTLRAVAEARPRPGRSSVARRGAHGRMARRARRRRPTVRAGPVDEPPPPADGARGLRRAKRSP